MIPGASFGARRPAVVLFGTSIPVALFNRSNPTLATLGAPRTISALSVAITITSVAVAQPQILAPLPITLVVAASKKAARVTTRKSRAQRGRGGEVREETYQLLSQR